jgi:protein involved in polysaccharide export with SLBB domain
MRRCLLGVVVAVVLAAVAAGAQTLLPLPAEGKVAVTGFVATPGEFAFTPRMTVRDVLALAGGVRENGESQLARVQVHRVDPKTGKNAALKMPADRLSVELRARDIVAVPQPRR